MSLIRLEEITKTYRTGDETISPLENVTLDIAAGELLVLLGPSGSGKTSLLNLVAGIDRPDRGRLFVDGTEITSLKGKALSDWRAENVGYVFQQFHLVPVLTAFENVELPLYLFGFSRQQRAERVSLALEAVGLQDRAHHQPRQLSGGQKQRVAIARAIVSDPTVLVCDEPTGNLDHASAEATLTLLKQLNETRGRTILMVTHDPKAARFGTRVLTLDKGQLLEMSHAELAP
ncbi:MAG: ABC transporter ATP-binding protein [Planctomycetota bacterium]